MFKKTVVLTSIVLNLMATIGALTVWANSFSATPLVQVSGGSPFSANCNARPKVVQFT